MSWVLGVGSLVWWTPIPSKAARRRGRITAERGSAGGGNSSGLTIFWGRFVTPPRLRDSEHRSEKPLPLLRVGGRAGHAAPRPALTTEHGRHGAHLHEVHTRIHLRRCTCAPTLRCRYAPWCSVLRGPEESQELTTTEHHGCPRNTHAGPHGMFPFESFGSRFHPSRSSTAEIRR
jgi:hypothetical protein